MKKKEFAAKIKSLETKINEIAKYAITIQNKNYPNCYICRWCTKNQGCEAQGYVLSYEVYANEHCKKVYEPKIEFINNDNTDIT